MKKASVLLAHGSSDARWLAPFTDLQQNIRRQLAGDTPLALAFMELAQPSLEFVVRDLRHQGYEHIDILPLFFAAGRHLRQDVPSMLQQLEQQLGDENLPCRLNLHSPIGQEPEIVDAISQLIVRKLS